MFDFRLIEPAKFQSMRWRNGLGATVELLKQSADHNDEFNWRLSIASVAQNGEFSSFVGYNRTLILLEGNGITLDVDEDKQFRLNSQLQQASFSGEAKTMATLHNGEIMDFNVMVKRTFGSASIVSNVSTDEFLLNARCDTLLVYAIENDLTIRCVNCDNINVPAGHLLQSSDCVSEPLTLSGSSFISIAITEHG